MALLDAGADIDQLSTGDQTSPLLIAVINGHFDLAMLLLDRGADPNLASDAGATPLFAALNVHWAPKARYPQQNAYKQQEVVYLDVMEALLQAGADPDARRRPWTWQTAPSSGFSRFPRRSRCWRAWAPSTTTTACPAEAQGASFGKPALPLRVVVTHGHLLATAHERQAQDERLVHGEH